MHKILLIIQREYLSRVKKKSFLVVTFLVPIGIMGMMWLMAYIAMNQSGLGDKKKVEVVDESGWFAGKLPSSETITYSYASGLDATKKTFIKQGYDYLLYIPENMKGIQLMGEKTPGIMNTSTIEEDISHVAQTRKLHDAHIDSTLLANAQQSLHVEAHEVGEDGSDKAAYVVTATAVGFGCAFLIYLSLLLYGAQVMRGVIEEKVSRIVEVIISSVKPFQLMLGKIIGVGMVGLTQFVLWIVLTFSLSGILGGAMGGKAAGLKGHAAQAMGQGAGRIPDGMVGDLLHKVNTLPLITIVCCFLFYFLFGYLLYSALFAAVGSAVDSETETQQFMIPITMPLIFTMMMAQVVILNNPDSTFSIWLSMIPFTSPIAMMIRIPFHVPPLQIACSMALMVLGFLFTTWVAGRIYRVGILMYGKKASYKELVKWFRYKE